MYEIIAQGIGIVAAGLLIMSYQQKDQKKVIVWQMMGQLLFSVNYLMLGLTLGACLNTLGFIRGIVYSNREKFRADKLVWVFIFSFAFLAVYAAGFIWFGKEPSARNFIIELMPAAALIASTISFRAASAKAVRLWGFVSSPLWLTYNIINFALGGIICEVFNLISIIVGIIRLDIKRSKKNEL